MTALLIFGLLILLMLTGMPISIALGLTVLTFLFAMTDVPIRDAPTRDALIALHFQNDICHEKGLIPFALDHANDEPRRFLAASRGLLERARRKRTSCCDVRGGT